MAGWIDRARIALAPKSYVRGEVQREVARIVNGLGSGRSYDASRNSRSTFGWVAGSTSANAETYAAYISLRNRARDLVRNNPHASKALRVLTNNIVGTGIMAQARTGDDALNKKVNDLWKSFVGECDFGGQMDFYGLQRLAVRSMLEGGDTITRLRPVSSRKTAVPLKLQLLEGDYLDSRKNTAVDSGNRIFQGIEFDQNMQRAAYWLFRDHPGDGPLAQNGSYISDRIPASTVLHLYEIQRLGQIRGVTWLAPAMIKARDLDTYEEAELVRKRLEACMAAFVIASDEESQAGLTTTGTAAGGGNSATSALPGVFDSNGNPIETLEPGLIGVLRGGKDVKFTQPSVAREYADYKRAQVRTMAAGWDLTYELLSGDLSQVNFSSIRVGLNEFKHSVQAMQELTITPMFLTPIWRAFIDFAVAAGKLASNTPYDVEWTAPIFESVSPKDDNAADVIAVRSLLMSPQEAIIRRGFDPDVVLADAKKWHESLEKAGVVSDADAAQTAKPGAGTVKGGEGGEPAEVVEAPKKDDGVTAP